MKLLRYTFDNLNVRKIIIISIEVINKLLKFRHKLYENKYNIHAANYSSLQIEVIV